MSNYRILRLVAALHRPAVDEFYRQDNTRKSLPFAQQREALVDGGFVHFNGFARAMRALGNDAHDIYCDVATLQQTWAKENAVSFRPGHWQPDIVLQQIEHYRPDVLFFQDTVTFPHSVRRQLKRQFPFLRLVVMFKASSADHATLDGVDLLLLGTPKLVNDFAGRSHLVYHAFDETIPARLVPPTDRHAFTFLGSAGTGFSWSHRTRYWALHELARQTSLEMWIFDKREERRDPTFSLSRRLRQKLRQPIKQSFRALPTPLLSTVSDNALLTKKVRRVAAEIMAERKRADVPVQPLTALFPTRCHPAVFGLDMYRVLQSSQLTFHQHGDEVGHTVGAARMFEATGVGAGLVTDTALNLPDLFVPDREVATYRSTDECLEKVRYLFDHETERQQLAAAGHRRTLKDHTVSIRCRQIHELISQAL